MATGTTFDTWATKLAAVDRDAQEDYGSISTNIATAVASPDNHSAVMDVIGDPFYVLLAFDASSAGHMIAVHHTTHIKGR